MYKPFKNREINRSEEVEVYRNLNNKCFSIRQNGLVIAHADGFTIDNVKTKISETGRQRVLKEKRKNVHATIIGENVKKADNLILNSNSFDELYYNPYELDSFINKKTGEPIFSCNRILFHDGSAYIVEK